MTADSTILLPEGTKFVTVGQAPALIARALAPKPSGKRTLYELRKVLPDGRDASLNQDERKALVKAWLPWTLRLGITEPEWVPFYFALMDNDDDGIPEVRPIWNVPPRNPSYNRGAANAKQKRVLLSAIKSGELSPDNAPDMRWREPNDRITYDARIPIQAFKDYAARLGVLVQVGRSDSSPPGSLEYKRLISSQAADTLHSLPNGTRSRREKIRKRWLSGKYKTRDACALKLSVELNMSYSTARKALINTPDPQHK